MNTLAPTIESTSCPHCSILASPEVWMEGEALRQLETVAQWPGCVRAVGLPDLHPGPGVPIGACFAFEGRIIPHLVGSDAGCGVRVVVLNKKPKANGDKLERRVREAFEPKWRWDAGVNNVDVDALAAATWRHGVAGLTMVPGVPESLADMARCWSTPNPLLDVAVEMEVKVEIPEALLGFGRALGTVGGGNHFVELGQVQDVAADEPSFRRGTFAVMAHSGSRGMGRALAVRWQGRASGGVILDDPREQATYMAELAGCVNFARANRAVLAWRLLDVVGAARPGRVGETFDLVHNTVVAANVCGQRTWLHRKGAAPAHEGDMTVVLGSRGAPSWMMRGSGSEASLWSVAHGAGRRMKRTEAFQKMKAKYTRAALQRTALGGRVICPDSQLLFEEHPQAYKAIEPVISSLEQAGAARRVASLIPQITVKC